MSELRNGTVAMTKRISASYFNWLTSMFEGRVNRTYTGLFQKLYETEFFWFVPHDDNRLRDGLELRNEFLNGRYKQPSERELRFFETMGATVLEVVVALSRRVAFTAGGTPEFWAWQLLENLRLGNMYDPLTETKLKRIDEILETMIWRTYQRDGRGGFFPLGQPNEDQTKVEIWYQMQKYVNEIQEP